MNNFDSPTVFIAEKLRLYYCRNVDNGNTYNPTKRISAR